MTDAADPAAAPPAVPPRPTQDWRILLAVFWVTSMVEGLGVSQIFALLPTYLREMGVPDAGSAGIHRHLQRPDLRGRDAARPVVGRLGRQVQPQGRDHPQRPGRGGRLRGGGPRPRAVAARRCDAAHRVPAGQHRDHAGGDPRRRTAPPDRNGDRGVRGVAVRSGSRSGRRWPASSSTASAGSSRRSSRSRRCCRSGPRPLVAFGSKEVRPEVVPTGRIVDLAYASLRGVLSRSRDAPDLPDLRHLLPGRSR